MALRGHLRRDRPSRPAPPCFDRLARSYRWLERFTFGTALERCRTRLLPELASAGRVLALGDGDGRALAALLRWQPSASATAIDLSPAMLRELRRRCTGAGGRLTTAPGDACMVLRSFPAGLTFDLVTSHFFLDCLHPPDLEELVRAVTARAAPSGAQWLVSEFRIPPGWRALPARVLIRLLYFGFRVLTGLRVRALPDYAHRLSASGWTRLRTEHSCAGLLTAELWQRPPSASAAL